MIAVVIVSSFLDDFTDTARALAHARFHLWRQTASSRSYCASPSCFMNSLLSQNGHRRENRRHVEHSRELGQGSDVVDDHRRLMAMQVGELIGLMIDQDENAVLGAKQRL